MRQNRVLYMVDEEVFAMAGKKIVTMPINELIPGMVAARDIYSKNEQLLIGKDCIIDANAIARITFFGIVSVDIYVEEKSKECINSEIRFNSKEDKQAFEKFSVKYEESIMNIKESMNQLLKIGDNIDSQKLIRDVESVVLSTGSKFQVFNMLHYIKDYDDETYNHSLNVSMICNVFADWLGMSSYEKRQLTLCGLMHDFGKLLISKEVLKKPGKLTDDEYEIIKQHPVKGYEFMKDKNVDESMKRAVLLHHERCDGSGYPFGMKVNEIDPYAAITAIADVYEAMTATRVYRKGLSPFRVIKLFEEEGRQHFNPIYLMPILKNLTEIYLRHQVRLTDGREGTVVMINAGELSRPVVMVDNKFVDLMKHRELFIEEVY